ncbi:MAG: hypothetical protein QOF76_3459 [Solirubrobacteraceae bacterium]|jgi:steroid 5-alpha reductase family enzyme|nr:hypothetical protein [Solirubrobacteraceae bacterium]
MTDLVDNLGFNPASNSSVFWFCVTFTFAVVTILWVVGLFQGNHSMMDGWYGFAFFVPALIAYTTVHAGSTVATALLIMVGLHGCRLGWYLAARWRRYVPAHGGDPRYLDFAKEMQPLYWLQSFFRVMEPQAVIIVVIGSPAVAGILLNRTPDGPLGILAFAGLALFFIGLYHESLADGQLQAFLAQEQRPRYLKTGVWKHSRHPNYFGNVCVWWGIWLVAMDGNTDVWWTVAGPVINTIMLTSVLGSAFQDNYMGSRPDYQRHMAVTRRFLPLPLTEKMLAKNAERIRDLEKETVA